MRRVPITEFLSQCKNSLLLDVRSPAEYEHAHIPGAISLPLFTNEERAVVGTAYKQKSREAAIKIGLDYFGPKMRGMVERVEELVGSRQLAVGNNEEATANCKLPAANAVFIYCWRGGMRSGAIGWLLNLYGFNVTVLAGGYKAFRNQVLQSFEQPYDFTILGGYTGSGKTEVLQRLKAQGQAVIDLEALASHKGSAFGNINMPPQPSQEMFENLLSSELQAMRHEPDNDEGTPNPQLQTPNAIWLEDESQRIGAINLPNALWKTMRGAPVYFLDIPFEERLAHITSEYGRCPKEKLSGAIERIKKRLGGLDAKTALQLLEEDRLEESFAVLLRYYDKQYMKALHNRENLSSLLTTLHCKTVTPQNATALLRPQHTT